MLLATDVSLTPILIALISSGGLAGAIVALLKIGPERSSAAVSQAQGAMETMQSLNKDLLDDRDYWKAEAKARRLQVIELEALVQKMQSTMDEHDLLWGNGNPT